MDGAMPDTTHRVQSVIDRFVHELTAIAREEAARVVMGGFGASKPGRKPASNGATRRAHGGEKRSPEKLEALQEKVLGFVKSHPGLRIEQINKQLATSTQDLALPIRKLIATTQLTTKGQRRATQYFAGSAKGAAKTKKRAKR